MSHCIIDSTKAKNQDWRIVNMIFSLSYIFCALSSFYAEKLRNQKTLSKNWSLSSGVRCTYCSTAVQGLNLLSVWWECFCRNSLYRATLLSMTSTASWLNCNLTPPRLCRGSSFVAETISSAPSLSAEPTNWPFPATFVNNISFPTTAVSPSPFLHRWKWLEPASD